VMALLLFLRRAPVTTNVPALLAMRRQEP